MGAVVIGAGGKGLERVNLILLAEGSEEKDLDDGGGRVHFVEELGDCIGGKVMCCRNTLS